MQCRPPWIATVWGLYGFFEPGELAAAPGSSSIAPLVLWVYLMIAVVLLVNLLIAMFNDTYRKIAVEDAEPHWKMTHAQQIKVYMRQYPVPPPLNVPLALAHGAFDAACCLNQHCRRVLGCHHVHEAAADTEASKSHEAETIERQAMKDYLEKRGGSSGDGGGTNSGAGTVGGTSSLEEIERGMERMRDLLDKLLEGQQSRAHRSAHRESQMMPLSSVASSSPRGSSSCGSPHLTTSPGQFPCVPSSEPSETTDDMRSEGSKDDTNSDRDENACRPQLVAEEALQAEVPPTARMLNLTPHGGTPRSALKGSEKARQHWQRAGRLVRDRVRFQIDTSPPQHQHANAPSPAVLSDAAISDAVPVEVSEITIARLPGEGLGLAAGPWALGSHQQLLRTTGSDNATTMLTNRAAATAAAPQPTLQVISTLSSGRTFVRM